ncbi:DUF6702 family protein [Thalassotalea profundi]|uniref:Orphan protein n=1 Tax=Thalassotalea profundi TaxID=2036687 RepID=A0ABQ3J6D2_9GAMM|nr:DUF6702 family protein [Thalassotalea profundi]GHF00719.1 hypothetical protein GCM10011501_32720 [Thalassotalea profundi]
MTMIKSTKQLIVLMLLALIFSAPYTFARQQKSAISTILFNAKTQNIEIMHRFRMHDAEHAVKHIFGKEADIINSKETKELFSDYIQQNFTMMANDKPVTLINVGYENDGKFFWVYQETSEPPALKSLSIRHNALRKIWPSQVNTINIERKGKVKTMIFKESIDVLHVTF